jgi:peroxiredoxin
MPGPVEIFLQECDSEFVIVLFYRGVWSLYCNDYLKEWERHACSVRAAGGNIVAISSEVN